MKIQPVMIGVPTRGDVFYGTVEFLNMQASKGYISILEQATLTVEHSRGRISFKFLQNDHFTHLFFLDDDVIAPDGVIEKLLAHDLPIVSASYPLYIKQRIHTCGFHPGSEGGDNPILKGKKGLIEANTIGLGACLIKKEVIKKVLAYPCYRVVFKGDYEVKRTDDTTFCNFARYAGYKIYIDTDIICDHIKKVSLNQVYRDFICPDTQKKETAISAGSHTKDPS